MACRSSQKAARPGPGTTRDKETPPLPERPPAVTPSTNASCRRSLQAEGFAHSAFYFDAITPVKRGQQATHAGEQPTKPDPAHKRFDVHAHRPGAVAQRLAQRH